VVKPCVRKGLMVPPPRADACRGLPAVIRTGVYRPHIHRFPAVESTLVAVCSKADTQSASRDTQPEVHVQWRPMSIPPSGDAGWARSCAGSVRRRA
jgi:hypothetical protein